MHCKIIKLSMITSLLLVGCSSDDIAIEDSSPTSDVEIVETPDPTPTPTAEELLEEKIETWLNSHSIEEKVAQMFIIRPDDLVGVSPVTIASDVTKQAIQQYPVGGLIYFSQNLVNWDQTTSMLSNTKQYYEELGYLEPFLSVDEEGGAVARIGNAGTYGVETFDPMWYIGQTGDTSQAAYVGTTVGTYLSQLGFNLDFAPDADVLTNPDNQVIGTRSFSSNPNVVSSMVDAEVKAMEATGVTPVIKHFPGHGGTLGDTHEGYAYTDKNLDQLLQSELVPFQNEIENGIQMIMVAHISVPNVIGDNTPSSLSYYMVSEVLREQLGYDGVVITDGMNMGAISNSYDSATAAVKAIQAGVDIILMPQDFHSAYQGILDSIQSGTLTEDRINESLYRILKLKMQ